MCSEWKTMESAPKDGTRFAATRTWPSGKVDVDVYEWEGAPNYWHCRERGVCIRPEYQAEYLWSPLPPSKGGKPT